MAAYIAGLTYKAFGLLVGTAFAFMGYRLFSKGVFETGDAGANVANAKLYVKKAAPGTIFAMFGVAVIAIATLKTIALTEENSPPISADILTVLNKVVEDRYVEVGEAYTLQHWLAEMIPNFKRKTYAFAAFHGIRELPAEPTVEKFATGVPLASEDRVVLLEWYATERGSKLIPEDIDMLLQESLIFHQDLVKINQLKLLAWFRETRLAQEKRTQDIGPISEEPPKPPPKALAPRPGSDDPPKETKDHSP